MLFLLLGIYSFSPTVHKGVKLLKEAFLNNDQVLTNVEEWVEASLADDAVHHLRDDDGHEVRRLARALQLLPLRVRPLLA